MDVKDIKFKKPNREWVKTAAIIFLAALLVLTFFSNTILNASLVEVSTAAVTDGTITAKVKGTGTVSAIGNTKVTSSTTTTINTVRAKEGAEVSAGDVLFIMGEAEELEEAQDELDAARYALMRANNSYPTNSYSAKVAVLQQAVDNANAELAAISKSEDSKAEKLKSTVEAEKKELDGLQTKYESSEIMKSTYETDLAEKEYILELAREGFYNHPESAEQAQKNLDEAQAAYDNYVKSYKAMYDDACNFITSYDEKYAKYTEDKAIYDEYLSHTSSEYAEALERLNEAKDELLDAQESEATTAASNTQAAGSAYIDALEQQNKIEKLEKKVAELAGGEDNAILAPVAGTVTSISVSPGDKVSKDTVLCIIQNPDMGYEISFSVTNDQAKRIKVGDTATVSNYYWGSEIVATVSSIKVDPKNSQTNKLVTCTLDGDVTVDSKLTVAVGEKSATYDIIVPNSAVRSDANGSFVYMVDSSRSNALGNRYFAKRVDVEVLASDDNNTAVSGNLSNGDFVITISSEPIKNGTQVRLADSSSGSNTDE